MSRLGGRKLELVCVLCNESLADLEKACAGLSSSRHDPNNNPTSQREPFAETRGDPFFSEFNDGPTSKGNNNSQYYGGYHSMSNESQKEVVATKCGHMFHTGCLRKHVHKTLIEGKGGALFCPICTRPFQMNRLWPVVIPPTKLQRERYLQLKMMKEQNLDMVQQLKQLRGKIAEEETNLTKLKEDAEQCLTDIQQKKKLLESVSGPTNKEIMELTKIHLKRQEILHVVTQHNADLLKLLAEESNVSNATAEDMLGANPNEGQVADFNKNYIPVPEPVSSRSRSRSKSRGESRDGNVGLSEIPSLSRISSLICARRRSKSKKKGKGGKTKSMKKKKGKSKPKAFVLPQFCDEPANPKCIPISLEVVPSKVISIDAVRSANDGPPAKHTDVWKKAECGTADTLAKWNIESMKDLMSVSDSFSELLKDEQIPPPPPQFETRGQKDSRVSVHPNFVALSTKMADAKDSMHLLLARKPPMFESVGMMK